MTTVSRTDLFCRGEHPKDEFDAVPNADSVENPAQVRSHSRKTQSQFVGDFLVSLAQKNEFDDSSLLG